MSLRRPFYAALLAGSVLAAGAAGFAIAHPSGGHGHGYGPHAGDHRGPGQQSASPRGSFEPGRFIEGRIAFLKAELKITDAQAPAFETFANVMREEAKAMAERHQTMRAEREQRAQSDQRPTIVERLELRTAGAKRHAESAERLLNAVKPLYAQLSDEQKATAEELMARRFGRMDAGERGHFQRSGGHRGDMMQHRGMMHGQPGQGPGPDAGPGPGPGRGPGPRQ